MNEQQKQRLIIVLNVLSTEFLSREVPSFPERAADYYTLVESLKQLLNSVRLDNPIEHHIRNEVVRCELMCYNTNSVLEVLKVFGSKW